MSKYDFYCDCGRHFTQEEALSIQLVVDLRKDKPPIYYLNGFCPNCGWFVNIPISQEQAAELYPTLAEQQRERVETAEDIGLRDAAERIMSKPPLGVLPRWLHDEMRLRSLSGAIGRARKAWYPIKAEWIDEYNELCARTRYRPEDATEPDGD